VLCAGLACEHARARVAPQQKVVFTEPDVVAVEGPVQREFRLAKEEHDQGKLAEAAQRLHDLAERPGLPLLQRASALQQEAVCRIEGGSRAEAEILLRAALDLYQGDREERVDPALPAQAEFWLGEAFRGAFREQKLDPSTMDQKALGGALEQKAEFLLSAQGHYLRCIRRGDGEWATAAGYRIGEMYEELHDQMVSAPLPRGLTEDQRALYQDELRGKVKNLVSKAIRMYEETLDVAQRTGAANDYVQKTEQALERMRKLLLDAPRG
jgi:tetratricopeptide (TPR) repeat protein